MILNSILGNVPGGRSFRPAGWVKKQLEIQAAGLAGNLDKVWRDVRDSAWIGGTADGWERVPYWLDGFIDLAWLLDDADMQARAKRYVDGILAQQKPDGWRLQAAATLGWGKPRCPRPSSPLAKWQVCLSTLWVRFSSIHIRRQASLSHTSPSNTQKKIK